MTSEVSVCNMALGHIGVDQAIASLSPASNVRERMCALYYEQARDECLQEFPWNFAHTFVALAEVDLDTVPPGWLYAYRYPTDCLRARVVTTEEGARMPLAWWQPYVWDPTRWTPTRVTFQVQVDPETASSRVILCDITEPYLLMTQRVEDPNAWSPLFVSALSYRLAAYLGPALRADSRLAANAYQMYVLQGSKAGAESLNESQPDAEEESPSVQVRR